MDDNAFLPSDLQQDQPSYLTPVHSLYPKANESKATQVKAPYTNTLRSRALKLAQQGEYAAAIALLDQLIFRHPESAIDYNNRGLVYFQSGERDKALEDYNLALELNPSLASAYNNRANYYAACGQLTDAIADYDRALDYNPQHVRAWINRAITLRDLEQYAQAIDNFEVALLFGQYQSQIWAERGRTYHLWGDWNCALADYQRALEQLPSIYESNDFTACSLRLQVEIWLEELISPLQNESKF